MDRTIQHNGEIFFLRLANDKDIPSIRTLVNIAYKPLGEMGLNYTGAYQDEQITRDRLKNGRGFVLEKQNKIVGTILFTVQNYFTNKRSGYISQLAIEPNLKGTGLGTILIEACEELARNEGFEAVQLDTAKPAEHLVKWYLRRGYEIVGDTRWEGKNYESWVFEKAIASSANQANFTSASEVNTLHQF